MARPDLRQNEYLDAAIENFHKEGSQGALQEALAALLAAMERGGGFIVPAEPVTPGQERGGFNVRKIELEKGQQALIAFTNEKEAEKAPDSTLVLYDCKEFVKFTLRQADIAGLVLDPWGKSLVLSCELLRDLLTAAKPKNHIYFEQCDITALRTECIVNAAKSSLRGGGGVDGAIHKAAGPELLQECKTLGGCPVGRAVITFAYDLPAKYVIHTVGPKYRGREEDARLLRSCYRSSLDLAAAFDLHSIAFPSISCGSYGYPLEEAVPIAMDETARWLAERPDYGMAVIFACYDQMTYSFYLDYAKKRAELIASAEKGSGK